ncbi:MAG: YjgN family protein [Treponemataceae bacterium]|nr:YjgN family protein [Treponemataceae bacterium]
MHERKLVFTGRGGELFVIQLVNLVLSVLTLGIYYAWGKVRRIAFFYRNTTLEGIPFTFHGTGKEIVIGYVKLILVFIILYGLIVIGALINSTLLLFVGLVVFLGGFIVFIPLMIHGALRYRLSRTSWRGIHMGYRGLKSELLKEYLKGTFLTIITLGIYSSWFTIRLNKYIYSHVRLGSIRFDFEGSGKDLFFLHLKGIIFTLITLGIYSFWYYKNYFNYLTSCYRAYQGEREIRFVAHLKAGDFIKTSIINALLAIITLGFALPWNTIRTLKMKLDAIDISGDFNPDEIEQTEKDYHDATGASFLDAIDIDIGDGLW